MFARSLPVSIAVHLLAIVIVFVVPLAAPVVLSVPSSPLPPFIKAAAMPAPPAPPPRASRVPSTAPSGLTDPFGVVGAPVDTSGLGMVTKPIELPATPPSPHPAGPVRVGELLVPPRKLVDVRPVYPEIARQARVEGIVILEAILDRRGRVRQVRVTRSSPLLDHAAIDAVRQWQYSPSTLHGQPVEVLMTITITFMLQP